MKISDNFIVGRKLDIKEVMALKEGTRVWCTEKEQWKNHGYKDSIRVVDKGRQLKELEQGCYYVIREDLFERETGLKAAYEVCMLSDVKPITFKEAATLEDGTKVFALDKDGGEAQWTTKQGFDLKCKNGTYYANIDISDGNDYSGREVKLYVDKNVEIKKEEIKGEETMKDIKVGDRVKHADFGLGTVVTRGDTVSGVRFDKKVRFEKDGMVIVGHNLFGKCVNGYGRWLRDNEIELIGKEQEQVKIQVVGRKVIASVGNVVAESKCHIDDEFILEIGQGIALERLGKKLQDIGNKKLEEKMMIEYNKDTFLEFLKGEERFAILCDKEEKAETLLNILGSLGIKWKSGNSSKDALRFKTYKERTCYVLDKNNNLKYGNLASLKALGYKIIKM